MAKGGGTVERPYDMDRWYPKATSIIELCEESGVSASDAEDCMLKPWPDEGKHYNWLHSASVEKIASWIIDRCGQ
jgi:hypothetical protein